MCCVCFLACLSLISVSTSVLFFMMKILFYFLHYFTNFYVSTTIILFSETMKIYFRKLCSIVKLVFFLICFFSCLFLVNAKLPASQSEETKVMSYNSSEDLDTDPPKISIAEKDLPSNDTPLSVQKSQDSLALKVNNEKVRREPSLNDTPLSLFDYPLG